MQQNVRLCPAMKTPFFHRRVSNFVENFFQSNTEKKNNFCAAGMEWMKVVLVACFYITVCYGSDSKRISFQKKISAGLADRPIVYSSAGAWDCFRNLTDAHRGDRRKAIPDLKRYFKKFGYMSIPEGQTLTEDFDEMVESAVKLYQRNFSLNVTGNLDEPTVSQLMTPRCGREDLINGTSSINGSPHSIIHYTTFTGNPRWSASDEKNLTYAFDPGTPPTGVTLTDMRAVFSRAFLRWAAVIPLTFTETDDYDNAHLTIGFFHGDHGDGAPFDGVLGTLAHAFSPIDGRLHLDAAELWTVNLDGDSSPAAVDLESVATHEIGHLLGLGHTNVKEAIMYPSIPTRARKVDLRKDDVEGAQTLYGSNPNYNASEIATTQQTAGHVATCLPSPLFFWSCPLILFTHLWFYDVKF